MKRLVVTILLLTLTFSSQAQNRVIDSLSNLPYEDLDSYFYKLYIDSVQDIIYGKAYLKKAKQDNDIVHIANAYYHLSRASNTQNALLYSDSSIYVSERLDSHELFPALPYLQKGITNFNSGVYQNALNDYLSALFYAKEGGNILVELAIRVNIGTLKQITGDYKAALEVFRDYVDFVNESDIDNKEIYLTNGLYQLANAYYRNGIIDSTGITVNKGYPMALQAGDSVMIANYTLLSGAYAFENGNYTAAIDSLLTVKKLHYSEELYAYADLFLGQSYLKLNNVTEGIEYLKEVDAYVQSAVSTEYIFLTAYKLLIDHYKKEQDLTQQLKYINNYLAADSLVQGKNSELEQNITYGFEISNILDERNELIGQLENKNQLSQTYNFILIAVAGVTLIFLITVVRINRINKKKFRMIISQLEEEKLTVAEQETVPKKSPIAKTELPDDISNEILNKLNVFEAENQFLKSYTLPTLARELKTNGTYLSKVINTYKSTNFSNYLNELRVRYVINRLDEDKKFRMYTIEAIAKESGYNTAQSFSKAFQRRTGLKPSYFINQLNNQRN